QDSDESENGGDQKIRNEGCLPRLVSGEASAERRQGNKPRRCSDQQPRPVVGQRQGEHDRSVARQMTERLPVKTAVHGFENTLTQSSHVSDTAAVTVNHQGRAVTPSGKTCD